MCVRRRHRSLRDDTHDDDDGGTMVMIEGRILNKQANEYCLSSELTATKTRVGMGR